ncbi:DUF308 domain-containing protein [Telluribacter sp. SYSU D00476]|uniref:DUF308 domain-containing protein n=1 Tax=Telluribacter sp. SYSU D00476 TaxID=2811430 RepID=UPI001FF3DAE4|nr:DUF308 domain-containing protein [Telluribacter sp. SYSU D00476]
MKKSITLCLLGATLMLGGCARQYPVFNQMPTNAYIPQAEKAKRVEAPVQAQEVAVVVNETPSQVTVQQAEAPSVSENLQVSAVLEKNTPKQIDQQLDKALASAAGQKLMANPAMAERIQKVRTMLAQPEVQNMQPNQAEISKAQKLADKTIKKHMSPSAAKALNRNLTLGLVLIGAAVILALIPGLGLVSTIVGVIGLVFLILGLINMA